MKSGESARHEQRALVWAVGRDGALTCDFLARAGFEALSVHNCTEICSEIERGAGVLVLASEVLSDPHSAVLRNLLSRQPQWSDIPIVVVAGRTDEASTLNHIVNDFTGVSVL